MFESSNRYENNRDEIILANKDKGNTQNNLYYKRDEALQCTAGDFEIDSTQ